LKPNPYEKYKSNAIFTASGEELTLMLYDGALKFCNQAIVSMEDKDLGKTSDLIIKVQNIVQEFQLTLDMQYEISHQLNSLYDYIKHLLVEANTKKDAAMLHEVRDHLRSLRDTWRDAIKLARSSQKPSVPVAAATTR